MSGPADNSWRCPSCGLAHQVHGCAPGKCWSRVWGVSISPDGTTGTLEMGPPGEWQPGANDNSVAHPLPWRWVERVYSPELGGRQTAYLDLVDNAGVVLIKARIKSSATADSTASPYVRAVTERAGAMEERLRGHLISLRRFAEENWPSERQADVLRGWGVFDSEALLAEIDAAKGGGR
jgi:hypothetical protein